MENEIEGERAEQIYTYFMNMQPSAVENRPSPLGSKEQAKTYPHDGLIFRSKSEIKIYTALRKQDVLFFANAKAVLASKSITREPDFLICQNGKWGILEVMGDQAHPSTTAMQDHERARLFKDYGINCIEFYDATICYTEPDKVVADFLKRLARF